LALLKANGIVKSYALGFRKHKTVLQNVSFEIDKGQFVAIIGKSGEGKTTFIKILAGLLKQDEGTLFFKDKKIGFLKGFYRKKISFVFQDYKLIPHFNVFENVSLPLRIRNISHWKEKTLKSLEYVGISHLAKQYPYQLSGGEAQRTSIARAICLEPEIIFADEPTGNLDHETESEILKVFQMIKDKLQITFIIVTHEQRIIDICDKVYRITKGNLSEVH
jgi:acetoin utilization transport system ATP-binding protein